MPITDIPLRIAHVSSLHCGDPTFDAGLMRRAVDDVNRIHPDVAVVAGDLTTSGYEWEYAEAQRWLEALDCRRVVVPGNHDSRNVGYIHFERLFGARFSRWRLALEGERAERLGTTGLTVVGIDSSEPDLDEGRLGREWYGWVREQFADPDDVKIFVLHHHLVSVPGTGRGLNVITDAGDVLPVLARIPVDVVLSGHQHVPSFWGLNGMLICNGSTVSSRRQRGLIPPSWNELQVDASTIKVYVHYEDGRRELSVVRMRATQGMIRDAFHLTDDFITANHILVE